jgi:hypothetical protein
MLNGPVGVMIDCPRSMRASSASSWSLDHSGRWPGAVKKNARATKSEIRDFDGNKDMPPSSPV